MDSHSWRNGVVVFAALYAVKQKSEESCVA